MSFRRYLCAVVLACGAIVSVAAQDASLTFDVVSVKPNLTGVTGSGMTSRPDGSFEATNITLRALILNAYGMQENQVVGGPEWLPTDRFDIVARPASDGPRGPRLQAMLADRFKLKTHTEMRERPVYLLVPARTDRRLGPSIMPATIDCSGGGDPGKQRRDAGLTTCGLQTSTGRNGGTVRGGGLPMARIATTLANYGADRLVLDRTGIDGIFDFELKWVNQPTGNADDVSFFTAVQEQLGLKLEAGTAPVEVLVIDGAERPDPN
jgi:uncharacterized protein (TIGR03435 family)